MFFVAPFEINVTAPDVQEVGDPLTLNCTVEDMGDNINISNPLVIVWISSNGMILQTVNAMPTGSDRPPVYTDSYTITQLTTNDHRRIFQCMANRTNPQAIDSGSIILTVSGKI